MIHEINTSPSLKAEKYTSRSRATELGSVAIGRLAEVDRGNQVSTLRGKGLAIARGIESEQASEVMDNKVRYNHPEIFDGLDITPVESAEDPERVTYEIPEVGVLSLLRIDGYDGKNVLQVDVAEINDDKVGQGLGTDMYRYAANHLPSGYKGILSGTVTNDAIHCIYETLGKGQGFLLHKMGNGVKPSVYFLERTGD